MNKRMSVLSKVISGICVLLLIAVLFVPLWRIELSAPQYPEGLILKIYPGKLGGDVNIVNGLNHYIGMHTLHEKDFIEFVVLPYIIGTFAFFGLLTIVVNRKWFFLVWTGFFLLFAIISMIDFYRWEYNYGHNLDPTAPIQVPGMTYQPPLIGFKQLLNFGAYSIPDTGGWMFLAVGLLLATAAIIEIKKWRHRIPSTVQGAVIICLFFLSSCSTDAQPIAFGKDACEFCKMTITDDRFGAELVTKKGKIYKFDDVHCLSAFLKAGAVTGPETAGVYLVDFSRKKQLVRAGEGFLLKSQSLHAPMGGDMAAFGSRDSAEKFKQSLTGTITTWNEISK